MTTASDLNGSAGGAAALLQALGGNTGGMGMLGKLLGQASLAPGQAELIEMFLSMQGQDDADDDLDISPEDDWDDDLPQLDRASDVPARERSQQELEALYEVNDTVAAALGACRYCWGGDEDCKNCSGDGHPGSQLPDKALFQELVLPALKRMRRHNQTRSTDETRGER